MAAAGLSNGDQRARAGSPEPFVRDPDFTLYVGDVREVLAQMPDGWVDCCVTSPPYWGLRDYGADGQIGLEETPERFVEQMVAVFREVRRVLAPHGTLWLNLGDSYAPVNYGANAKLRRESPNSDKTLQGQVGHWSSDIGGARSQAMSKGAASMGIKQKDLVGIPWRVAFALQADGWFLRSDIIWAKPNPMPESVTDRPTKAHEYVFLLSKSPRYFFDQEAVREPAEWARWGDQTVRKPQPGTASWIKPKGKQELLGEQQNRLNGGDTKSGFNERWREGENPTSRNVRTVWEIATQPYAEAHFATFPEALPERCIKAGCPTGGTVLDPFMGSGTTALVARRLGRRSVGVELNREYAELCARRLQQLSLLAEESVA